MENNVGAKKATYDLEKARSLSEAYKRSGLSQREFCRHHEIRFSTFKNWLYRLRKEELSKQDLPLFTPLKIRNEEEKLPNFPALSDLQIRGKAWTIIVPVGFDSATLRRLLKVLEA